MIANGWLQWANGRSLVKPRLAGVGSTRYRAGVRLIVYLLIFGLCPGAAETLVDAGHTLLNGHSPHSEVAVDTHDHESHDEHSCSVLFHLCGCHAPAPTTTATRLSLPPTKWSELPLHLSVIGGALLLSADGSLTRANRPPIA